MYFESSMNMVNSPLLSVALPIIIIHHFCFFVTIYIHFFTYSLNLNLFFKKT
uniref:Uncharacterized protein n=1 Tax=Lepeophtheirus salmonis TaxID=72036 RepID=A0A0K2TQZ2_LEPSM